jgi:uncharacterized lipoprotein YmbA
MNMFQNKELYAALVMTALLGGCSSSPKPSFYTLSSEAVPMADAKATYSVAVGPLSLPGMLDRPQMVVRVDANRVEIDEFHRWAGPLQQDLTRVILTSSQAGAGDADYRVAVDVQRFDTAPGSGVTIEAAWTIRRKGGSFKSGHTVAEEPVATKDFDALVAAHSRALVRISRDIAQGVQTLAAPTP